MRIVVSILAALSMAVAPSTAWAAWNQPSGGPLDVDPAANAFHPATANVGGVPYVAWIEKSAGHFQVFVKRLDGSTWVQVGGSLNLDSARNAQSPDIASVDGVPLVAWVETNRTNAELYVKRLIAGNWVAVGSGPLNVSPTGNAANPSIVAIGGVPYVAWDEEQPGGHSLVFVDRFAGGAWVPASAGTLNVSADEDAQSPKLADVAGIPYVAWHESDGRHDLVHVRRFDGTAFIPVGSDPLNLSTDQDAVLPSVAAVDGVPYVAWSEARGFTRQIFVKRLAGPDWTTVGGSLNFDAAENAGAPTIASVGGAPAVVWQELNGSVSQIRFGRFDGTAWHALGGPLNVDPAQNAMFVDPTLLDVGGVPYVTWEEANGSMVDVRVKRLEPDILSENLTPSGSGVTLTADVNDFGMPLPVGFEYGTGAFTTQTTLQLSPGAGVSTITALIDGLQPGSDYLYRAFGSDTFRETSVGATEIFTTPPAPPARVLSAPAPARITGLVLSPVTFSVTRGLGTRVSYVDSEAATTTFTVQRAVTGRRVGGRCVAVSRRNHAHGHCTRYLIAGSFTHADAAGANHFRFRGRAGEHTLAPGRYRLRAIPHNLAGSGPPAYRKFEVKP